MSFDQTEWIWMNGRLIPWREATVHVSAHALHYGTGVFEGIRCYETAQGPALFRLGPHLDRFYFSAQVHGIPIPCARAELEEAICETIQRNGFRSCYVRPICYYASDSLSVHPRNCPVDLAILTWPWATYLGAEGLESGVRLTVSSWTKFHSRMMPTTAKACGQYLNSVLAVREAIGQGCDEALLLDVDGTIAEGSGENLFIVRGGALFTNDEASSILPGITRDAVIEIARRLGLTVEVGALKLEDLFSADEAFFTGTACEVTPVREVGGRQIGSGRRGPITLQLQDEFFKATSGRDPRYRDWLHFVHEHAATRSG